MLHCEELRVKGLGFRVEGLGPGLRASLGLRVKGQQFRVWILGFGFRIYVQGI